MRWNWQQADWPDFRWDSAALAALESRFLQQSGVLIGSVKHLGDGERATLTIDIMTGEALKTSEIEGELLNRDSVQSSLRRQFGLETDHRKVPPAERGIAEMMMALYRDFAEPLTDEDLYAWHRMVVSGRADIRAVGRYRDHADPMQVVSGPLHKPKVHFEAPPSHAMADEMARFLAWFAATAPDGPHPLPGLTRAGIAHLYFVSIHPFEDGNGRVGRAIVDLTLARDVGDPTRMPRISRQLSDNRDAYYEQLQRAQHGGLDVTSWIAWFISQIHEACDKAASVVDLALSKATFWATHADKELNARQRKVLKVLLDAGPGGFEGGMNTRKYEALTGTSRATASRELIELGKTGFLVVVGAGRSTRYYVNMDGWVAMAAGEVS